MRIEKMRIKNYRRFKDTKISFSNKLTILAGANNSGKTSLVYLLDCILGNNNSLKSKDISLPCQSKITKSLFSLVDEKFNCCLPSDLKTLQSEMVDLFIDKKKDVPIINVEHIIVQITVTYEKDENISMFAQYLMDLDSNKRNFEFEISQELSTTLLKRNLEMHAEALQDYLKRYYKTVEELSSLNDQDSNYSNKKILVSKYKQLLIEKLFKIYGESLEIVYKYANKDFLICHRMEKKEFEKLFNYNYLCADRQLNDNNEKGRRSLTSSVVDLLNIERKSETSPNEWKSKVQSMLDKMFAAISSERIDSYLVDQAKTLLNSITQNLSNIGETNIQEITMVLDMGMDFLFQMLKGSVRVNYAIPTGSGIEENVLLGEESQGLGISNLIYITLELMSYKLKADCRLVNIFIIEEPESHMHLQMQKTLINYLLSEYGKDDKCNVQGMISTHSDEIVRSANLRDVKVIRPKDPLVNVICDMNEFLEKHKTEKNFYETFFRINFSKMIFADKAIIYEGDTERMYIESILFGKQKDSENEQNELINKLSQKYITFAQAGGAYAHKYAELLNELEIRTLVLTDIDYEKNCFEKTALFEQETTNAALKFFCKSDITRHPDGMIKIKDIYDWQINCDKEKNILVKTQTKFDGYARTLEEAILYKYISYNKSLFLGKEDNDSDIDVFSNLTRDKWETIKSKSNFSLVLPNRNQSEINDNIDINKIKRCIRQIVKGISDSKSDFMYSIIIAGEQFAVMPTYIKEGLEWLAQK